MHFNAAASLGKCPRARTALRMRALTLSIAFVLQMTLRISTSKDRIVEVCPATASWNRLNGGDVQHPGVRAETVIS